MKKSRLSGYIPEDIDKEMRIESVHQGLRYPGEFIPWLWNEYKKSKEEDKMEKMSFKEFIEGCDVSHWRWSGKLPKIIERKNSFAIAEVYPCDDPNFIVEKETKDGTIVDWGEKVMITDDPYQHAYTVLRFVDDGYAAISAESTGYLYSSLEEAREEMEDLIKEDE